VCSHEAESIRVALICLSLMVANDLHNLIYMPWPSVRIQFPTDCDIAASSNALDEKLYVKKRLSLLE